MAADDLREALAAYLDRAEAGADSWGTCSHEWLSLRDLRALLDAHPAPRVGLADAIVQTFPEACWCGYDPEDLPSSNVTEHLRHTLAEQGRPVGAASPGVIDVSPGPNFRPPVMALDAHPTPSEPEATVERLARERYLWRTHGHEDLRGETSGEPEATVVEEWGVRHAQGVYAGDYGRPLTEQRARAWAEENRARDGRRRREAQGKTMLLRRIVTEWEEVDD